MPVVRNANGEKLSKQTGAQAIAPATEAEALAVLLQAGASLHLGVDHADSLHAFWQAAIPAWARRYCPALQA